MAIAIPLIGKNMISRNSFRFVFFTAAVLLIVACTPKEPARPAMTSSRIEQLKMQSRMKALAAEVVKLRDSQNEVEALKASIAAMDSQIVLYQELLDKKIEEPKIEVVSAPRDPDIINLKGNIYVLIREMDSLKIGMKDLELLNDSLEIQIEQLAVQANTEMRFEETTIKPGNEVIHIQTAPVTEESPVVEDPVLTEEPVMASMPKAQGYAFNSDYRMAYNDALNRYFNREYLESIQDFRVLIEREPRGAYADNAQYWIGECYYSIEDFESAVIEFGKVFSFPENNKSDHALFKIAISYQQLGRFLKARETMNRFILDYPESELVSQARNFLEGNRRN